MWIGSNSCVLFIKNLIQDKISFSTLFFWWTLSRQLYFWLVLFKVTRYEKRRKEGKHGALSTSKMPLKGPTKSLRQGKLNVSIIPYPTELACMNNWAWLDYLIGFIYFFNVSWHHKLCLNSFIASVIGPTLEGIKICF